MNLVDWADRHDISRLYLDEVHRYEGWSQVLKNIYDDYPDMSIVYTSSSLLVLDNPNLMHVLCPKVDKGNERETFFISQLRVLHDVRYPKQGDFAS